MESIIPLRMILTTISSDPNLQLKEREALNVFYVGMTNTYPPFDNQKVRQAIAMGIDRQRIVDNFLPERLRSRQLTSLPARSRMPVSVKTGTL